MGNTGVIEETLKHIGKPLEQIFAQFAGLEAADDVKRKIALFIK
jgi:hypothetical protein